MKYYNYGTIKLKRQREQKLGVATVTASRVKFYTKKDTLPVGGINLVHT